MERRHSTASGGELAYGLGRHPLPATSNSLVRGAEDSDASGPIPLGPLEHVMKNVGVIAKVVGVV